MPTEPAAQGRALRSSGPRLASMPRVTARAHRAPAESADPAAALALATALALAALAALAGPLPAAGSQPPGHEVAGVRFDGLHRVEGRPLELSGLGLHRYRALVKLYAMALYVDPSLPPDARTARTVLESDVPKRLELETFWKIPARVFQKLTRERIARALPPEEFDRLAPQVEALNALYEDVEPGDRYAITYVPGRGTELAKNGVTKGVVEGEPFARAMFGIWLGDDPFDRRLRAQLIEDAR